MRWLAAWVAVSLVAFLVAASNERITGTLAAPGGGESPGTLTVLLGLQLVVAVVVTIAVLTRRSRSRSAG